MEQNEHIKILYKRDNGIGTLKMSSNIFGLIQFENQLKDLISTDNELKNLEISFIGEAKLNLILSFKNTGIKYMPNGTFELQTTKEQYKEILHKTTSLLENEENGIKLLAENLIGNYHTKLILELRE